MIHPAENAWDIIDRIMAKGSTKDGRNEAWRDMPPMYHFVKALGHLTQHIKEVYDPRSIDGENHAHLALTRIAMGITAMQKQQGGTSSQCSIIRHEIGHYPDTTQ